MCIKCSAFTTLSFLQAFENCKLVKILVKFIWSIKYLQLVWLFEKDPRFMASFNSFLGVKISVLLLPGFFVYIFFLQRVHFEYCIQKC